MRVLIRGNSVAAWCCAHLLKTAGLQAVLQPSGRPGVPAVMLSDSAVSLIREVFGKPNLFLSAHRISRRVVKWGHNAEPVEVDHSAVVVSDFELLSELEQGVETVDETASGNPNFTIFASRPLPPGSVEQCFGARIASAARIRLKDAKDSASCWIESLEEGWLFLIPNAIGAGWLLSVGAAPAAALSRSRVIAERIASMDAPTGEFPAAPRIVSPLCGSDGFKSGWIACGTAGLAFDPICGDGTAHAVREAILASAVIRAVSMGEDATPLLAHYEARLTAGFCRHLAACLNFYQTGDSGPWWNSEVESLRAGLQWCSGRMQSRGEFRYRLQGFELLRVAE